MRVGVRASVGAVETRVDNSHKAFLHRHSARSTHKEQKNNRRLASERPWRPEYKEYRQFLELFHCSGSFPVALAYPFGDQAVRTVTCVYSRKGAPVRRMWRQLTLQLRRSRCLGGARDATACGCILTTNLQSLQGELAALYTSFTVEKQFQVADEQHNPRWRPSHQGKLAYWQHLSAYVSSCQAPAKQPKASTRRSHCSVTYDVHSETLYLCPDPATKELSQGALVYFYRCCQ